MAVLGKHKYWRIYVTAFRAGYTQFYFYVPMIFDRYLSQTLYIYGLANYVNPLVWRQLIQVKVGGALNATTNQTNATIILTWGYLSRDTYPFFTQSPTATSSLPAWFKVEFQNAVELPVWFMNSMPAQIGSANIEYSDDDSQWTVAKTFSYSDLPNTHIPLYAGDYPIITKLGGEHSITTAQSSIFVLGGLHKVTTTRLPLVLGGYHTTNAPPASSYKASLSNLEFRYSGGSSNAYPDSSLGGVMSSEEIVGQRITPVSTVPGITVLRGSDNLLGLAKIKVFTIDDGSWWMQWEPSGISGTSAVNISGDGYYTLPTYEGTETGYICIDVVFTELVEGEYSYWVDFNKNSLFDDIDYEESLAGDVSYRCIYLYNNHLSSSVYDITLYIKRDTLNPDSKIELGLDPAGVGGTPTTIANEYTAPAGVVFSSPTKESPLYLSLLRYDLALPVWVKRTIYPGNPFATSDDSSLVGVHARF